MQELYRRRLEAADVVILSVGDSCNRPLRSISVEVDLKPLWLLMMAHPRIIIARRRNKACPNGCSGTGTCTYVDVHGYSIESRSVKCLLSSFVFVRYELFRSRLQRERY